MTIAKTFYIRNVEDRGRADASAPCHLQSPRHIWSARALKVNKAHSKPVYLNSLQSVSPISPDKRRCFRESTCPVSSYVGEVAVGNKSRVVAQDLVILSASN